MSEPDEIEERVRADIARVGWHVALVPPDEGTPGWALSIGLVERFDHPELVVFGPDLALLHPLVNHLGAKVRAGARYEAPSEHEGILQGYRVAFRPVDRKWYGPFLGNASWHYGHERFPVLQVFWPDRAGHFPWEPASDPAWRQEQPLLGEAETHRALSERLIAVLRREGAL